MRHDIKYTWFKDLFFANDVLLDEATTNDLRGTTPVLHQT